MTPYPSESPAGGREFRLPEWPCIRLSQDGNRLSTPCVLCSSQLGQLLRFSAGMPNGEIRLSWLRSICTCFLLCAVDIQEQEDLELKQNLLLLSSFVFVVLCLFLLIFSSLNNNL